MMANKSHYPLDGSLDIARSSRDVPPAHFTLKIDSFSQLVQTLYDSGTVNYESDVFEVSGYKWKLSLYPNGDKSRNGEGHISLYLVIAETKALPAGWEVKVNLKLFVFDQIQGTYSIFQDNNGKIWNFHEAKTEFGFAKLLPLEFFKDPSNGFLVCDKCVFGVEVFVWHYSGRGECITSKHEVETIHTWTIDNFSSLQNDFHLSDDFTLGNRTWAIEIHPKGDKRANGEALSLFLMLNDTELKGKAYVNYKLRVKDQLHAMHEEITGTHCFSRLDSTGWGHIRFLTLNDLNNASKGFLVKDTLIVEVEIISVSCVKSFS